MVNANEFDGATIFRFLKNIPSYQTSSEEVRVIESVLRLRAQKRPSTAENICLEGNIHKAKVYAALKLLRTKNFVTIIPGTRPAEFELIRPSDMKHVVVKIADQANSLIEKYDREYSKGSLDSPVPILESVPNREQFYIRATELVNSHPPRIFMLSRRGAFYASLLDEKKEPDTDYEKGFVRALCDYSSVRDSEIFALITQQTEYSASELQRGLEQKFKSKNRFFFQPIQPDRPYEGVTCLLCQDRVLLGWSKGGPKGVTEEGLLIKSSKIHNFISALLTLIFKTNWS
jgi:hypothetical protein